MSDERLFTQAEMDAAVEEALRNAANAVLNTPRMSTTTNEKGIPCGPWFSNIDSIQQVILDLIPHPGALAERINSEIRRAVHKFHDDVVFGKFDDPDLSVFKGILVEALRKAKLDEVLLIQDANHAAMTHEAFATFLIGRLTALRDPQPAAKGDSNVG